MIKVLKKGSSRRLATYLEQYEFDCKCCNDDCSITLFSSKIGTSFYLTRLEVGLPITVTSGYRCPRYNKIVPNSAELSLHQSGQAIDLLCPIGVEFKYFHRVCDVYFGRTVPYPELQFIHCEVLY